MCISQQKNAYIPIGRKYSYYTFGDFFIQTKDELPPEGIKLQYWIRHNNWKEHDPGLHYQERVKRNNGRWSNYDSRVHRQVVYCGTMRIVPHYERSAHKSCRTFFNSTRKNLELQEKICKSASKILGRDYNKFELLTYSKYGLPLASTRSLNYSGFNMGAGECSVFDILFLIYHIGKNALIIIDEIELGLHEQAQRKFVQELKQICKDQCCQIICSTHSSVVLDELPPEGRFFIKNSQDKTDIVSEISIEIATGALSGRAVSELDIFVEDRVAQKIIQTTLDAQTRNRISVVPIGSAEANLRVMASRYLEGRRVCLCILDGDKRSQKKSLIGKIVNYTEAATDIKKKSAKIGQRINCNLFQGKRGPKDGF